VTAGRTVSLLAPAKVNLYLRVGARREDGFHDIDTLFQAIGLADRVEVSVEAPAGDDSPVGIAVSGAHLGPPEANLAWRAARAFLSEAAVDARVHIRLEKRIPAGAGLGGGSSDAAAVLRALQSLLPGRLSSVALGRLGATLGSDVPFFLGESPLALACGRGEVLEPLRPLPAADVVVVTPPVHVATAWAYRALDEKRARGGAAPERPDPALPPDDWVLVAALAKNDFEEVVPSAIGEVAASLETLREEGASPALLSGSGGACFGIFPDAAAAERAARTIGERLGWPATATRTLERFGRVRGRGPSGADVLGGPQG